MSNKVPNSPQKTSGIVNLFRNIFQNIGSFLGYIVHWVNDKPQNPRATTRDFATDVLHVPQARQEQPVKLIVPGLAPEGNVYGAVQKGFVMETVMIDGQENSLPTESVAFYGMTTPMALADKMQDTPARVLREARQESMKLESNFDNKQWMAIANDWAMPLEAELIRMIMGHNSTIDALKQRVVQEVKIRKLQETAGMKDQEIIEQFGDRIEKELYNLLSSGQDIKEIFTPILVNALQKGRIAVREKVEKAEKEHAIAREATDILLNKGFVTALDPWGGGDCGVMAILYLAAENKAQVKEKFLPIVEKAIDECNRSGNNHVQRDNTEVLKGLRMLKEMFQGEDPLNIQHMLYVLAGGDARNAKQSSAYVLLMAAMREVLYRTLDENLKYAFYHEFYPDFNDDFTPMKNGLLRDIAGKNTDGNLPQQAFQEFFTMMQLPISIYLSTIVDNHATLNFLEYSGKPAETLNEDRFAVILQKGHYFVVSKDVV